MTQKVGIMVLHGIGSQKKDFADGMEQALREHFRAALHGLVADPDAEFALEPAWWAPVVASAQNDLWWRVRRGGEMRYDRLRRFLISSGADAVAYQPIPGNRVIYDAIHERIAQALNRLVRKVGPSAPLCVIAHSLGTIIASNYFWDLQSHRAMFKDLIAEQVLWEIGPTPLENGKTLTHFYTLGSPIALWSLRFSDYDFGQPMRFPDPDLQNYYPDVETEWINFYDRDDVIGFPLRTINPDYERVVTEDREVNVGKMMESWNPASHLGYWTAPRVVGPIAEALIRLWHRVNPGQGSSARE